MLKKLIISINIILISNWIYAQSSQFAFFYEAKMQSDSTNKELKSEDLLVLWHSGSYSVFQSYYKYEQDNYQKDFLEKAESSGNFDPEEFMKGRRALRQPRLGIIVHKDLNKKEMVYQDSYFFANYFFQDQLWEIPWKISKETKMILGKKCTKATASVVGREWVAWFTEEIPISDGPHIFHGLPGLIMELYDTNDYFHFILVEIENREVDMSKIGFDNLIKTTRSKLFETKRKYYKDVRLGMGTRANMVSPETLIDMQERYNKTNNPIILKWD